jgi:hypothetical protein
MTNVLSTRIIDIFSCMAQQRVIFIGFTFCMSDDYACLFSVLYRCEILPPEGENTLEIKPFVFCNVLPCSLVDNTDVTEYSI